MSETPDYTGEEEQPAPDKLKQLTRMAREMAVLTIEQSDLQDQLKKVQEKLKQYAEKLMPELMKDVGLEKMTAGGFEIAVKEIVSAKFPEDPEAQQRVARWIEGRGEGGVIHKKIVIEFSNSLASADQVAELIQASLPPGQAEFTYGAEIHHSTLGRVVREARKAGASDIPREDLKLYEGSMATIKAVTK